MCSGQNMELYKFTKTGPFSLQFSLCHTLHQANPPCFLYCQPSFLFPEQSSILPDSCKVDLCTRAFSVLSSYSSVPSVLFFEKCTLLPTPVSLTVYNHSCFLNSQRFFMFPEESNLPVSWIVFLFLLFPKQFTFLLIHWKVFHPPSCALLPSFLTLCGNM